MKLYIGLILFIVVFIPIVTLSQDEQKPNSIKLEAGLGGGFAGQGGGMNLRAAIGFISHKWGAMARLTAQEGGKGPTVQGWLGDYQLTESFSDQAILASRVITKTNSKIQVITSAGVGSFLGEKLNESKTSLISIDNTVGLAYEIGLSTTGHFAGVSSRLFGNINKEAVYIGVAFSIIIGPKW